MELAVLERAEQLGLGGRRSGPDLVEEQRAAVGQHVEPVAIGGGTREGTLPVAEELALPHLHGHRRAVHPHVGRGGARAQVVEPPGQELLARPRLAPQQHRGIGGRGGVDHGQGAPPGGAVPEGRLGLRHRSTQVADLALQGLALHGPVERDLEGLGIDRLQEVVAGPALQALDGGGDGALAGQDTTMGISADPSSPDARARARRRRGAENP